MTSNSVMSTKSVPEHPLGWQNGSAPWCTGQSSVSRTNFTFWFAPVGTTSLIWPSSASVNSLPAPTPLNAVVNVVPSADVSIRNCRVDAEPPSPQPAVGLIRNFSMLIASGSSIVIVGGPACGLPGSALVGLKADHVVPCDWSIACLAPQPPSAPVSSD